MLVQLNTDSSIAGNDDLAREVTATVEDALDRFAERITRVEVHLNDVNRDKGGVDKRCLMEARIGGRAPLAVESRAETLELAVSVAAEKLVRAIESDLGRLADR
jgi:hypothetical protein